MAGSVDLGSVKDYERSATILNKASTRSQNMMLQRASKALI